MKKMLFIVNPMAGQRKILRCLSDVIGIFNAADYEVSVYITASQGDGARIARLRAAEHDAVVCAGGDGTLNEVIHGILTCGADKPIGYIPAGSTNDFASSLKLSTNILQAAQDIVAGKALRYDVGLFEDRHFSYVASFGAFTRSSYNTPQSVKNALGHLAYVLDGIQELPQIRATHIRFELDSGEVLEDDYLFGAVSNTLSVGGILTLDPTQVDMRDGLFELMLIRAPRNLTELGDCIKALQSQQYDCGVITFRSVRAVTVFHEGEIPWTLDGEKAISRSGMRVENLHHAIGVLSREEEAHA